MTGEIEAWFRIDVKPSGGLPRAIVFDLQFKLFELGMKLDIVLEKDAPLAFKRIPSREFQYYRVALDASKLRELKLALAQSRSLLRQKEIQLWIAGSKVEKIR